LLLVRKALLVLTALLEARVKGVEGVNITLLVEAFAKL
jgi:hypothetical protein